MNKKMKFLIEFSFMKKVMRKSFVISNVIFLVLLVIFTNLDSIIKSFGGDFTEEYIVYYQDDFDNNYYQNFKDLLENFTKDLDNDITLYNEAHTLSEDDKNVIIVDLIDDGEIKADIKSNEFITTSVYTAIFNSLNTINLQIKAKELDLSVEELSNLTKAIEINRDIVNEGDEGEEVDEFTHAAASGLSFIVVIPLFFGLIMIIQMIGLEIFDEKSTKSMEILMSNVDAKTHLNAKLIAVNIFAITQFVLLFLYGLVGIGVRKLTSNLPSVSGGLPFDLNLKAYSDKIIIAIILIIVLYILTNLLYSLVMAILASTANEVEDYQKIVMPLMILMLIGFYTAIFTPMFDGAVFAEIMSFIPFFSLMVAPGLYISGDLTVIGMLLIILVQFVTLFVFYKIGLPIYKQSVLDYSQENVFKRFVVNFKKSKNKYN